MALYTVDLAGGFLDPLLQVSQLVLQRLYHFLSNLLLLLQLLLTRLGFLVPVLVLLAHRLNVIRYKIDTLAQRIGALAQHLDCFLHELYIFLTEPTASLLCHSHWLSNSTLLHSLRGLSGWSSRSLLCSLSDSIKFNLGPIVLNRLVALFLVFLHQSLGFLHQCSSSGSVALVVHIHSHAVVFLFLLLLALSDDVLGLFLLLPLGFGLHLHLLHGLLLLDLLQTLLLHSLVL